LIICLLESLVDSCDVAVGSASKVWW